MQVCSDCGAANEDNEDFCGQCGAYLEWDGERAAAETGTAAAAPVEPQESDPVDQPHGLVGRVREAVGLGAGGVGAHASADASSGAVDPTPVVGADAHATTDQRAAPVPVGEDGSRTSPDAPPTGTRTPTAASTPGQPDASTMVVKVPPPPPVRRAADVPRTPGPAGPGARTPSAEQPGAVRPGAAAPKARPTPRAHVAEPVNPGDLICGECGAGNKPTRKFCRRCGHDLVEAVVAKVPWWKRILPRRQAVAAGSRGKEKSSRDRPMTTYAVLLGILVVLAIVGFSLRDAVGGAYQRVVDRVVGSEPVRPKMSASSSAPGAPAAQANDGTSNKFWAPADEGDANGEFLRAEFKEPFRLLHLIITPGVSTKQPEFLAAGRPSVLSLMVTDESGEVTRERLELKDTAGPQTFDVVHSDVERVRLTIVSSEQGSRAGTRVAIAEVEFRGRD